MSELEIKNKKTNMMVADILTKTRMDNNFTTWLM